MTTTGTPPRTASAADESIAPIRNVRKYGFGLWLAIAWLILIAFGAILGPMLPLPDPHAQLTGAPFASPSSHHLFGTDLVGHDLFSQVLYGGRVSMIVGATSVVLGLLVGGSLGIIGGYLGGAADAALLWVTDVLLTFPGLVFALALVAFAGPSLGSVLIAIDVLAIPIYARIARATTLTYARQDFVLAAELMGATRTRVMVREIAPNVAVRLLAYAALGASVAILAEGGLAYLGVSVPGSLSWGSMIAQGQSQLQDAPQAAFAPMLAMFLTLLSLTFIGERLGASIDPREANVSG